MKNDFEGFKKYIDLTLRLIQEKLSKEENEFIELMINTINIKSEIIDNVAEELSFMSTNTYTDDYDIKDEYYDKLMIILKGSK